MDKVLIAQQTAESGIDFLKEKGYDILYVDGTDEDAFAEAVKECSALDSPEWGGRSWNREPI